MINRIDALDPIGVTGMARLLVQDPPEQLVKGRSRPLADCASVTSFFPRVLHNQMDHFSGVGGAGLKQ